jgi:hydroxymethylpyrimidine pyrophosphatase-like HAD family hydrolase
VLVGPIAVVDLDGTLTDGTATVEPPTRQPRILEENRTLRR